MSAREKGPDAMKFAALNRDLTKKKLRPMGAETASDVEEAEEPCFPARPSLYTVVWDKVEGDLALLRGGKNRATRRPVRREKTGICRKGTVRLCGGSAGERDLKGEKTSVCRTTLRSCSSEGAKKLEGVQWTNVNV